MLAHPPSASTLVDDTIPRRNARRDAKVSFCSKSRTITQDLWGRRPSQHPPRRSPELGWREKGGRRQSAVPVPSRFRDPRAPQRNHFWRARSAPETNSGYGRSVERTGLDHVGICTQPHLPRISQACPCRHDNTGRKAMTEVVTAFLVFVSIGVFLAHAFDAYRLR